MKIFRPCLHLLINYLNNNFVLYNKSTDLTKKNKI